MTIQEDICEVGTPTGPMRTYMFRPSGEGYYPGVLLYSEIFQVTGPIWRTAALIASHGYVVAVPEIYHELEPAGSVLPYDTSGADRGNAHKIAKEVAAYDSDAFAAIDCLRTHPSCNGRFGVMGICIGGHLAFRAAMHPEVLATACFYATDLHKRGLGKGMQDDSLERAGQIRGELLHIWGRQDPHVPLEGRQLIHSRLEALNVNFQWLEVNAAHAFLRDEGPRYDAALARQCYGLVLEMFQRCLR